MSVTEKVEGFIINLVKKEHFEEVKQTMGLIYTTNGPPVWPLLILLAPSNACVFHFYY